MNSRVRSAYEVWQGAVRRHDEQLRDARRRGFTPMQIRNMTQGTLLALDVAYARFKQAEADAEHEDSDLLDAALRALAKPLPEDSSSIH